MKDKITEAYKKVLLEGIESLNPYTVAKAANITEAEFFKYFGTIDAVAKHIWAELFNKVQDQIKDSEAYKSYGAREKVLAYFFTFFEVAVEERSFINKTFFNPIKLEEYRKLFREYAQELVEEGIENQEIKERLTLSSYYPDALWTLHLKLVHFWLSDESEQFVETEKAIEVYSKIPLELMGENFFDSVFDSLKFTFEKLSLDKINIFGK